MNRYYWLAIILAVIGIASIVIIWQMDLTDPELEKKVEFTLTAIAAVNAVSSIALGIIGALIREKEKDRTATEPIVIQKEPVNELLSEDESITQYLANLEASLDSVSSFVELSAELGPSPEDGEVQLLQSFEWAKRDLLCRIPKVTRQPIDFLKAHERFQRYVLLGDPGSGKTICLQYLTSDLISEYRNGISKLLPFYVRLSEWEDRRANALEFLKSSFEKLAGSGSYLAREFEALLSRGDLLIILDGLNEMPDRRYYHEERDRGLAKPVDILAEVSTGEAFRSKQDPRERSLRELAMSAAVRTRVIVSCRTHEFYGSPSWQEIYVLPMNEDQICSFVQTYMGKKAIDLQTLLDTNGALRDLARNPFFLRSMVRVFSPDLSVVENKGQFLEYLCNELLVRERNRGMVFHSRKLMKFASRFAFDMLKKGLVGHLFEVKGTLRRHQSLVNVLIGTGLLVPRGKRQVSFYHQIIQEFFAAYALRQRYVHSSLERLLSHKKWSEVIVLWHDIDATSRIFVKLLQALKLRNRPWRKPFSRPLALLGFDLVVFFVYVFILMNIVIDLVFRGSFLLPVLIAHPLPSLFIVAVLPIFTHYVWLFSTYHRKAIVNAAYVLGQTGNPIAINHLTPAFQRVGVRRTEIAKALKSFGKRAVNSLISALSSEDVAIRIGAVEALGLIGDPQAVDPLLRILKEGNLKLIGPTCTALGNIGDPRTGPAIAETLLMAEKVVFPFFSYASVAPTLQQLEGLDSTILQVLRQAASKDQPRFYRLIAARAIAACGHPEALSLLREMAIDEDEDPPLRVQATTSLGFVRTSDVVDTILDLYQQCPDLQENAINALAAIAYPEALPGLHKALGHKDWRIRHAAVRSLSLISDPRSLPELEKACNDQDEDIRAAVAQALGTIGMAGSAEPLLCLCQDPQHEVRTAALASLDFAFPSVARTTLAELASDIEYPDRIRAIELLGSYRFPEVREVLMNLCADVNSEVRAQAVESLKRIDRGLIRELHYVPLGRKSRGLRRILVHLRKRFVDEYLRLLEKARLLGVPEREAVGWVIQQIQDDSELKRQFRPVAIAFVAASLGLFVIAPPVLAAIVARSALFAGVFLWKINWISFSLIAVAIISLLPGIRRGRKTKILGTIYKVARFLGFSALLVLVLAATVYYWWISVPLVFLSIGVLFLMRKHIINTSRNWFEKLLSAAMKNTRAGDGALR